MPERLEEPPPSVVDTRWRSATGSVQSATFIDRRSRVSVIGHRRIDYNINRPHSAHGWLTPVEFVEAWLNQQQLTLA
jgi:hypothetical protein